VALPETRYATNNGLYVAYQQAGTGPVGIVMLTQWFSNVRASGTCRRWPNSSGGSAGSAAC
jgi:hypothetical protein